MNKLGKQFKLYNSAYTYNGPRLCLVYFARLESTEQTNLSKTKLLAQRHAIQIKNLFSPQRRFPCRTSLTDETCINK